MHVQPIHAEGTVPYGRVCSCGKGMYQVVSRSEGAWYNYREVKCNSHTYGTDIIQKRDIHITYKCNACGKGYTSTATQQKRIYHGYDK